MKIEYLRVTGIERAFLEKSGQDRGLIIRELNDEKEPVTRTSGGNQILDRRKSKCRAHEVGRSLAGLRNSKRQEHREQGVRWHGMKSEKQARDSTWRVSRLREVWILFQSSCMFYEGRHLLYVFTVDTTRPRTLTHLALRGDPLD